MWSSLRNRLSFSGITHSSLSSSAIRPSQINRFLLQVLKSPAQIRGHSWFLIASYTVSICLWKGFPKLKFIACVLTTRSFWCVPSISIRESPDAFGVRRSGSVSTVGIISRIFCRNFDPVRTPVSAFFPREKLRKNPHSKWRIFFQIWFHFSENTASCIRMISNLWKSLSISIISSFERHLWTFHTHRENVLFMAFISWDPMVKIFVFFCICKAYQKREKNAIIFVFWRTFYIIIWWYLIFKS